MERNELVNQGSSPKMALGQLLGVEHISTTVDTIPPKMRIYILKGGVVVKEVMGGLWLGALGAGAFLGFVPALILFMLGLLCALCELNRARQAAQKAKNWRKNYPSYKY